MGDGSPKFEEIIVNSNAVFTHFWDTTVPFASLSFEHFRKKNYLQPITEREEDTVEGNYLSVLDSLAEKDIIALVQQLSPGYRTVFNMYVIEGYTHKQIAEALGISEGTSKSQLSRAKMILQDLVKQFVDRKKRIP